MWEAKSRPHVQFLEASRCLYSLALILFSFYEAGKVLFNSSRRLMPSSKDPSSCYVEDL